jgi:hypothetical protein
MLRRVALERSVLRLLVTANIFPRSLIHVTLMMQEMRSSETSVLTGTSRRNIADGGILQYYSMLVLCDLTEALLSLQTLKLTGQTCCYSRTHEMNKF